MRARECVYIEPTDDVLRLVAGRMNEADVRESQAIGFEEPLHALRFSRDSSVFCMAAAAQDGEVLGVGGLVTRDDLGIPWAILTQAGARRKRWVLREARRWIADWSQRYELRNGLHAQNAKARALVEVLGFELAAEPYRHELTGEEFFLFAMPKKPVGVPLCASS